MATFRRVPRRPKIADLRAAPGNAESNDASVDAPEPGVSEAEAQAAVPEGSAPAGEDLSALRKDQLVSLADERGLDSSGTKAEIISRLGGEG